MAKLLQYVRTEAGAGELARRDPRVAAAEATGTPVERMAASALVELYRYGYRCGWDSLVAYGQNLLRVAPVCARNPEAAGKGMAQALAEDGHAWPEGTGRD